MPITSNFTQAQLDALTAAIAQGMLRVEYSEPGGGTRMVIYNTRDDMLGLRDRMIREMNAVGDGIPRPNARGSVFTRG